MLSYFGMALAFEGRKRSRVANVGIPFKRRTNDAYFGTISFILSPCLETVLLQASWHVPREAQIPARKPKK